MKKAKKFILSNEVATQESQLSGNFGISRRIVAFLLPVLFMFPLQWSCLGGTYGISSTIYTSGTYWREYTVSADGDTASVSSGGGNWDPYTFTIGIYVARPGWPGYFDKVGDGTIFIGPLFSNPDVYQVGYASTHFGVPNTFSTTLPENRLVVNFTVQDDCQGPGTKISLRVGGKEQFVAVSQPGKGERYYSATVDSGGGSLAGSKVELMMDRAIIREDTAPGQFSHCPETMNLGKVLRRCESCEGCKTGQCEVGKVTPSLAGR